MTNQYAIYLRKSRADIEAESRGEGETLARHREALWALAKRRDLMVVKEYAELVTGDSIAVRPQMQLLLEDIKQGKYAGVIVNDVDRLGRGDGIDQEIVKLTFAAAHCIIITPNRDIDPGNPTDNDMLEFSMFFARFELRKISQRLMQGRTRSALAGNYLSARIPFGYKKVTNGKGIRLEPDPAYAPIVQMIFDWYTTKEAGTHLIARKLYDLGIKTYFGNDFDSNEIRLILRNTIYIGTLTWGRTTKQTLIENGVRVKKSVPNATYATVENAHPAIISREQFELAQQILESRNFRPPVNSDNTLKNPLAGLIFCKYCGKAMYRRPCSNDKRRKRYVVHYSLYCRTFGCPTSSIYVSIVENAVLEVLDSWCAEYKEPVTVYAQEPDRTDQRAALEHQLDNARTQLTKAQEFVELGVYSPADYIERRNTLQQRIDALTAQLDELNKPTPESSIHNMLPKIKTVIEAYSHAQTIDEKNALLKSIIARIEYDKTQIAKKGENPAQFLTLTVYPKLV